MIKLSHDRIGEKSKRNFIFRTMFFDCDNHEALAS